MACYPCLRRSKHGVVHMASTSLDLVYSVSCAPSHRRYYWTPKYHSHARCTPAAREAFLTVLLVAARCMYVCAPALACSATRYMYVCAPSLPCSATRCMYVCAPPCPARRRCILPSLPLTRAARHIANALLHGTWQTLCCVA